MAKLHRVTLEALSILKSVFEDQAEDRLSYRNEIRRLVSQHLVIPFSEYEHFLTRYGYLSINQRNDAFNLTSAGHEAVMGDVSRQSSLNDDVNYHFQKEIEEGNISEAEPTQLSSGRRFDQHYIRFDGIGRGGIGSVWRAEHLKTGRAVAIKTLEGIDELLTTGRKSTLKKRLERVIRSVAKLDHPFIAPILDMSLHHTPPYYVMPLCSGGSLRTLIDHGSITPEVGLNLFAQICLALNHAHQSGVLHLDLKPENIILDDRGNVNLFDFGLSKAIARQVSQVGRQSYIGLGSVAYMPPEVLRDPELESPSIDIYALGLILYEILVGELPGRRSPMPSEVIKGLPEPVDELFDCMTQDLASRRPQAMRDVLELVNRIQPFDRLSQQSMVMIFEQSPLPLPGLTVMNIPEPEFAEDLLEADELDGDLDRRLPGYRMRGGSFSGRTSRSSLSASLMEPPESPEPSSSAPSSEETFSADALLEDPSLPSASEVDTKSASISIIEEIDLSLSASDEVHRNEAITEEQTPAPSTAAQSTAAPSTAAPSTAAPSTAAPSTAAPSTASIEDEGFIDVTPTKSHPISNPLREMKNALAERLKLKSNLSASSSSSKAQSTPLDSDPLQPKSDFEELDEIDFIEDVDLISSNSMIDLEELQHIAQLKRDQTAQNSDEVSLDDFESDEKTALKDRIPHQLEPDDDPQVMSSAQWIDEREPSVVSANQIRRSDPRAQLIDERLKRRPK